MATSTFIPYIPPRPAAPAPQRESHRPPARRQLPPIPHDLLTGMAGGQSGRPAGSHTLETRNGVEVVDLTDSDQEGPTPERQAVEDGQPRAEGECTWRDVEALLRSV